MQLHVTSVDILGVKKAGNEIILKFVPGYKWFSKMDGYKWFSKMDDVTIIKDVNAM